MYKTTPKMAKNGARAWMENVGYKGNDYIYYYYYELCYDYTQYMLCGHLLFHVFGFPRRRTKSCWRLSHRDIYDNNMCVLHIVSICIQLTTTKYPRRK